MVMRPDGRHSDIPKNVGMRMEEKRGIGEGIEGGKVCVDDPPTFPRM